MDDLPSYRFYRTTALTKWLIFGVLLPLLPIGSKIMAQWVNNVRVDLTPIGLFGDGELLVIATVIAAAGIGDLVFDLRKRRQGELRDAAAVSLALICVIVSVLLYGLVTLKRQTADPAQQVAAVVEKQQEGLVSNANREIYAAQAAVVSAQNSYTQQRKLDPTGKQPLTLTLQDRVIATTRVLTQLQTRLPALLDRLSAAQQSALRAQTVVSENTAQASVASLVMFILSFIAGAFCLLSNLKLDVTKPRRTALESTVPLIGIEPA